MDIVNGRRKFMKRISVFASIFAVSFLLAAGAMIFVVVDEIIPEMHGKEHARLVTFGVITGFVIMMFLDNFIEPLLETLFTG